MKAEEAIKWAELFTELNEHDVAIKLIELDNEAWQRGFESASKIILEKS